ncbi:SLC13 family permease [Leucothrix mucor]|uniref:SLC13 family permease n=1 Tax=Leucothrix mucor TaxID=45248 RepID=UPI0003B4E061|nr:SLC13 family permease [Leucothrix mucor]
MAAIWQTIADKLTAQTRISSKTLISAILFTLAGAYMVTQTPTIAVSWVVVILLFTIYLFVFEVVDVDVAAVLIMVLLGLSSLLGPYIGLDEKGLVDNQQLFNGFSSNAVMSIIAVMIIGAGLDKTGVMSKVATFILRVGGTNENRIIPIVSSTVAFISSFMQNVGAAALFLPVVARISSRSGLPMSRLLMPMGFCAILGGTVTMVGSSPLILLNDLIHTSNQSLPADKQMDLFGLFAVTPIGAVLVLTGIFYFVVAGRYVLPVSNQETSGSKSGGMQYFQDVYGINYDVFEVVIPPNCELLNKHLDDVETEYRVRIVASKHGGTIKIGPGAHDRDTDFKSNMVIGIVASPDDLDHFVEKYHLWKHKEIKVFGDALSSAKSGMAEVVIPPRSQLVGKSARDVWMRKVYGIAMVGLHRAGATMREGEDIRSIPLQAGDTLVVHTTWSTLARLEQDSDFLVVSTEFPHEELRPQKVGWAGLFFSIALFLVLFTDIRLSIALLTGALGMVLSGVLRMDEAYRAVSWKTVFLLASLIPLGMAVETSGTAAWIATLTLSVVGDMHPIVIQSSIMILATFFTLVMSNVGATVLLVPLAINIAHGVGADPAVYALTVAIGTSNSFLIPTHQVNALIMGPAGYRVVDFIRAGSVMTILFLIVSMTMMWLLF